MRFLLLLVLLIALPVSAKRPAPGVWMANGTQYWDEHTLCLDGRCYCLGEINGGMPSHAQCTRWYARSFTQGVTDSAEMKVIWGTLAAGEFHAFSVGSCPDGGALGPFLPVWGKAAIGSVPALVYWRAAHKTPLAYSTAKAGTLGIGLQGALGVNNLIRGCH